jgi:transposase
VNKEECFGTLCRLRNAVRKKSPETQRTNIWFLLHGNAPAHRSVLVKDFLSKNKVTTLEHPPHSPDLVPAGFYLFLRLKPSLKGQCFCEATGIIKNATEELKRLPGMFPTILQSLADAYTCKRGLF